MMRANGKVIYLDIGCDYPQADGDLVTDEMHDYFYSEGDYSIYSSPVDYIDGSGAVTMTYKNGFSLVFDDYNHDGNPDYTIRIVKKENGSYYDVRCMDVNGTPWEDNTEVFLAGEFAESVRLQVTEKTAVSYTRKNACLPIKATLPTTTLPRALQTIIVCIRSGSIYPKTAVNTPPMMGK